MNLPVPKTAQGWLWALVLTCFLFPIYYLFLFPVLNATYEETFWSPYKLQETEACSEQTYPAIYVRVPKYVSEFVMRKLDVVIWQNSEPAESHQEQPQPEEHEFLILVTGQNDTKKIPGIFRKTTYLDNSLETSSTTINKLVIPETYNLVTRARYWVSTDDANLIYSFYYDGCKLDRVLASGDSGISIDIGWKAFVHSFMENLLLPPWSNILLLGLCISLAWYLEFPIQKSKLQKEQTLLLGRSSGKKCWKQLFTCIGKSIPSYLMVWALGFLILGLLCGFIIVLAKLPNDSGWFLYVGLLIVWIIIIVSLPIGRRLIYVLMSDQCQSDNVESIDKGSMPTDSHIPPPIGSVESQLQQIQNFLDQHDLEKAQKLIVNLETPTKEISDLKTQIEIAQRNVRDTENKISNAKNLIKLAKGLERSNPWLAWEQLNQAEDIYPWLEEIRSTRKHLGPRLIIWAKVQVDIAKTQQLAQPNEALRAAENAYSAVTALFIDTQIGSISLTEEDVNKLQDIQRESVVLLERLKLETESDKIENLLPKNIQEADQRWLALQDQFTSERVMQSERMCHLRTRIDTGLEMLRLYNHALDVFDLRLEENIRLVLEEISSAQERSGSNEYSDLWPELRDRLTLRLRYLSAVREYNRGKRKEALGLLNATAANPDHPDYQAAQELQRQIMEEIDKGLGLKS